MAGKTNKRIDRVGGNARRVVEPLMLFLYFLAYGLFAVLVYHYDSGWQWRLAVVAIGTILVYRVFERSNFVQALSDRAARNGVAWTAISVILAAARAIGAAVAWLFTGPPFRLLARLARPLTRMALSLLAALALPLTVVITAALSYRLAVFPALVARGPEASGFDLLVLVGDWLLFGPSYGLVGAAAPLVTLLLLLRRRRSSLGLAALLHGVALVGTCLAFGLCLSRSGFNIYDPFPANTLLFHPISAAPEASVFVRDLFAAEVLGNAVALYLVMRPQVRLYYRFPKPEEPGAAVIAFGVVVVYLKVLRARSRLIRALTDRAARSDTTGFAISKVLGAARRIRAAFARLCAIPPVWRLAHLALLLAFVAAAAVVGWPQPQP